MEISENIYERVVEPSYQQKNTRVDYNPVGIGSKNRLGASPSNSYLDMSRRTGKQNQRYLDSWTERS